MSDVPSLLQPLKDRADTERGCSSDPCGSKVCKAQRDRVKLIAAIEAVAGLHTRAVVAVHEGHGEEAICGECGRYWPCNTVRALTQALGGDTA